MKIKMPLKYRIKWYLAGLKTWWQQLYWTHKYVGRRVVLSKKHIKNVVLNDANYEWTFEPGGNLDYAEHDYDQKVLLAMFMAMDIPIWGEVKGVGLDCVLCHFFQDGCTHWGYYELESLVFLD